MSHDRKTSYKVPPAAVINPLTSQDHRRQKALEEQKRRRAERFDSTRQLDFFADLTLGPSDEEADEDDSAKHEPEIVHEGVSSFASMLPSSGLSETTFSSTAAAQTQSSSETKDISMKEKKRGKKRKGKARQDAQGPKNKNLGRWADKCMYAELLEMIEDAEIIMPIHDGIPEDIETGWVAVTPVPAGKRCLAVTHHTSGIAGIAPNLTLRSRVLGKPLMKPFPSPLPPQTVLDCILDENWRENGILHVLDVLKWKGQDVGECETPFRFWWRDTRLSELTPFPPPPSAADSHAQDAPKSSSESSRYQFPHPNTLLPIPYHTNTTLLHLANALIPMTRAPRCVSFSIPSADQHDAPAMDLDAAPSPLIQLQTVPAEIKSDGLLLYVAQATYEPGTSPLSSWVPLQGYATSADARNPGNERIDNAAESPLVVFERLVKRRLSIGASESSPEVSMEENM